MNFEKQKKTEILANTNEDKEKIYPLRSFLVEHREKKL